MSVPALSYKYIQATHAPGFLLSPSSTSILSLLLDIAGFEPEPLFSDPQVEREEEDSESCASESLLSPALSPVTTPPTPAMPFTQSTRRDSWPPTILQVDDDIYDAAAVDADPLQYFLATPDQYDDMFDDFGAGIESDTCKQIVREISPSSIQETTKEKILGDIGGGHDLNISLPITLRDLAATVGLRSPSPPRRKSASQDLKAAAAAAGKAAREAAGRGRTAFRLTRSRKTGRGQTRSLPTRRPHSWSMPSPDVWCIPEEEEEKIEIVHTLEEEISTPRSKKSVHWAS